MFEFQKLEGQKGTDIADAILLTLEMYNINGNNTRDQGYNGAAAMSGKLNGVQAIIPKLYMTVMYVHCMSLRLNNSINL